MTDDITFPHLHCLPFAELHKEFEVLDAVVSVPLGDPFSQRHEFHRFVIHIMAEALLADRKVLLHMMRTVAGLFLLSFDHFVIHHLQVIRVRILLCSLVVLSLLQVKEFVDVHRLLLDEFDVLVQVAFWFGMMLNRCVLSKFCFIMRTFVGLKREVLGCLF